MKKFVIAAVAAVALNTTANAESCASNFSGFYAGLQAGMNASVGTVKIDGYAAETLAGDKSNFKVNNGSKSFIGGLFAGYGMGIGTCAYVGGEIYGNFTNTNNKVFDTSDAAIAYQTFKITAKNNMNFGAKIRLGYTVSPQAMIFLGLGLEHARWQVKCENITPTNVLTQPQTVDRTTKKNKAVVSFAPSVGMEMFMTKNIFVRGEYTYVMGTNQKLNPQQNTGLAANAKPTSTVKVNNDQHRFALGLGYKF
jgi:opacity protein-like surface antigen